MDRAFESGAAGSAPTAPAIPSIGYATGGNPGSGTPPTKPGPWWYHMVTEELRAIIAAAGLTPAQGTIDQVLQALPGALASRPEMAKSLATNGYQKLPGGLIIQWGVCNTSASEDTNVTYPIAFPTAAKSVVGTVGAGVLHITFVTNGTTASSFFANAISSGGRNAQSCSWVAIGY